MVSHKNDHLLISLTSKSISYFIDGLTLRLKSQPFAYLLSGSETCILDFGPWSWGALNIGFVDQASSKNARTTTFFEVRRHFRSGSKSFYGVAQGLQVAGPGSYPIRGPFPQKLTRGAFGPVHIGSQVPSPNMKATFQLLSLKKPLKNGSFSLESDLDLFYAEYSRDLHWELGLAFARPNSQHKSLTSPQESVVL